MVVNPPQLFAANAPEESLPVQVRPPEGLKAKLIEAPAINAPKLVAKVAVPAIFVKLEFEEKFFVIGKSRISSDEEKLAKANDVVQPAIPTAVHKASAPALPPILPVVAAELKNRISLTGPVSTGVESPDPPVAPPLAEIAVPSTGEQDDKTTQRARKEQRKTGL